MEKKVIILFTIIAIIYIIVGAFLFLNIQLMDAPEIIINIEVADINSENAILHTKIDIDNPNSFKVVVKNLLIVTTTNEGYEVARTLIQGGEIGSNEKKTFTGDITVAFNGHSPELLTTKITGEVGANILFIQKIIPLNVGIVTSLEHIFNDLTVPNMNVAIEVADITTERIEINATIDVFNPNNFEIYIEDISNDIETESGKKIGKLNVIGGKIPGKGSLQIKGNGSLLLEAFNEEHVNLNLSGIVGATIAGFEKNLSFDIKNKVIMPNLEEIMFSKDKSTILSVKIKGKLTLRGYLFEILMGVENTYKVDIEFRNITSEIYFVKNDDHRFIGKCENVEDIVVESGSKDVSTCEILVPYSKLFPFDLSTDWIMNSVSSRISIVGINQSLFFEIRGYQDFNILT
jgi:LEA14-like dessication related protein